MIQLMGLTQGELPVCVTVNSNFSFPLSFITKFYYIERLVSNAPVFDPNSGIIITALNFGVGMAVTCFKRSSCCCHVN